ncbi:MAG: Thioredoxin [Chroococcopsis gigantea SAG 12.99]|jgi:thioredoxin 1|nr:redoxin domain-containing protein [Chlorogloea purpurea SAG 13.99]MDV3002274.1 Thioredoxin [Chroococcopsis gigantea SAG 12.99]
MMLSVSEKNFSKTVLESPNPVLVHFWAPWCGLCRLILPTLAKFQSESCLNLEIVGINADDNFRLANRYRLRNLPTIILFHGGEPIARLEDFQSRDDLYRSLKGVTIPNLVASNGLTA